MHCATARPRRALSLLLALVLLLGLVPGLPGGETASAHWADPYLSQLLEWGFIRADQTGSPDKALTRADFMSIVNRAYGYHEVGVTPFEDVGERDWFYDDVGIAYNARYIHGTSPTTASPNDTLTRETAATILGRNMMLQESTGEILDFSDARDISNWSRGTIKSSLEHYLVSGYDDGTFRPQKNVTWGEMAALISRTVGTPLQEAGDYSLGGVFGNVTVTSPGVTLRDTVISGDLYITGGVGQGNIKLENVTVLGRIIASGSGESEGGEASILLRNVTADELLVDNLQDNYVTVRADGVTDIGHTTVRTSAYIEDNTPDGMGLKYISLEGETYPEGEEPEDWEPIQLDLAGRIGEVVNRTPNSQVKAAKGTVAKLTVDEAAVGSTVVIDRGAVVKELNLDTGTTVTGEGDIEKLVVNAPGSDVAMLPDEIVIRPGITAIIAGEEMDSTSAEEASLEPLILAGYPKAQDVAPTSLEAVFSTNKKGTIYWAVSAITDGSVGADDLIKPPSYGNIALRWGTTVSPRGNEESVAKISGLQPDGSYYLSAVLEDARGLLSPVKVISFTTPDNKVPAFCTGYPHMSKVSRTDSVAVVMPNKDCKLYYALLPQGAQAPTETELKTGAVSGALGYGVEDVYKNEEKTFRVNDRILEEETTYVLYLWLVDANGANKSAITSLTFTTDDETPPEFIIDPSAETAIVAATSVRLNFRLNEKGTVYWVAVLAGTPYPQVKDGNEGATEPLTSPWAKLQVRSGLGIGAKGKSGSVAAGENVDGVINVTGLDPESYYDFYYVAKDDAGPDRNYSVTVKKITIHTEDSSAPTVKQSFFPVSDAGNPKTSSNIYLDFSEDVIYTGSGAGVNQSLWTMFEEMEKSTGDAKRQAKNKLANAIFNSITLRKFSLSGDELPIKENHVVGGEFGKDVDIDYTQVQLEDNRAKGGGIRVIFPNSGLHLENGGQYCFLITNLLDSSRNPFLYDPIDFWSWDEETKKAAMEAGYDVNSFIVDFPAAMLERVGIEDDDRPQKRDMNGKPQFDTDAEGNETAISAFVDRAFSMKGDATSAVDPALAYDIQLWTNRDIEYQLYYRLKDSDGVVKGDSLTDYNAYLLSPSNGDADSNGWMYLGHSGTHYNEKYGIFTGKSVGQTFNKLGKNSFPKLTNMQTPDNDLSYEFAISLTKWGTLDDRTEWTGKTEMQVHVAAGVSENLQLLGQNIAQAAEIKEAWWDPAVAGGLKDGILDIGSAKPEKYLKLPIDIVDTKIPSFTDEYPKLTPSSTKVDMKLFLDREGDIYYAISKVNPDGTPVVGTTITGDDGKPRTIKLDEVPKTWPNITDPALEPKQPNLILPNAKPIYQQKLTGAVDSGKIHFGGDSECGEVYPLSKDLEPDTTYYVYFVLKGTQTEYSQVYIYQFTTKKSAKPQININDKGDSSADIWTEQSIPSNYVYRVYTEANARNINPLNRPFSGFVDTTGNYVPIGMALPDYYSRNEDGTVFTVLDAMKTSYNFGDAGKSSNTNAYYPTTSTEAEGDWVMGASIFDIYANEGVRETVDEIIRTASQNDDYVKSWFCYDRNTTVGGGEETATNQPVRNSSGNVIEPRTPYIILVAAQNQRRNPNDPPSNGARDAFKAAVLEWNDDSAPNLVNAFMGDLLAGGTQDADGNYSGPFTGSIFLEFDKSLHYEAGPDDYPAMDSAHFILRGAKGTIAPTTSGEATQFELSFEGYTGTATMTSPTGNFLVNKSGAHADETLTVSTVRRTENIGTRDAPKYRNYIQFVVEWGRQGQKDYLRIPLAEIDLSTVGTGAATKVTDITLTKPDEEETLTNLELTTAQKRQNVKVRFTTSPEGGDTSSITVDWAADPTGIVTWANLGRGQNIEITAAKAGTTILTASVQSDGQIIRKRIEVTVKPTIGTSALSPRDGTSTITAMPNTTDNYTWKRASNSTSSGAMLTFDTGFAVDTRSLTVTSSDPAKVSVGDAQISGTTVSVPLTWLSGNNGNITITINLASAGGSKTVTITLDGPSDSGQQAARPRPNFRR